MLCNRHLQSLGSQGMILQKPKRRASKYIAHPFFASPLFLQNFPYIMNHFAETT